MHRYTLRSPGLGRGFAASAGRSLEREIARYGEGCDAGEQGAGHSLGKTRKGFWEVAPETPEERCRVREREGQQEQQERVQMPSLAQMPLKKSGDGASGAAARAEKAEV